MLIWGERLLWVGNWEQGFLIRKILNVVGYKLKLKNFTILRAVSIVHQPNSCDPYCPPSLPYFPKILRRYVLSFSFSLDSAE